MTLFTLFILAIGLSMDAFAVSICKGLAMTKLTFKNTLLVGIWFGGFQMLMPIIGYFLGIRFKDQITSVDHWIAFVLLSLIGGNMLYEALRNDKEKTDDSLSIKTMFILAVATSIDALAIGITFAFLNANLFQAVSLIGITAFSLSVLGVKTGNVFGIKYKAKAEIIGGIILILLGMKILFEHLF